MRGLYWAALPLAAGALACGVGALGVFGRPPAPIAAVNLVGAVPDGAEAFDCPGGQPLIQLRAGDLVLVMAETLDGAFLAVRSPALNYDTVWVETGRVSFEGTAALPISGCIEPTVTPAPQ